MVTAWQQDRKRKQAAALKSESVAGLEAMLGGLSDMERQRIAEEERKRKAEAADAEMGMRTSAMEARTAAEKARAESNVLREKRLATETEAQNVERAARADVLRKKAGAEEADRAREEADRKRADTVTSMSRRMDALTSRADVEKAAAEAGMAPDEFLAAVGEEQEKALGESAKAESKLDLDEARTEDALASAEKKRRAPVLKPKAGAKPTAPPGQKITKDATPLRKEFTARPEVKKAIDSAAQYDQLEALVEQNPSAGADMAIIYSFMKTMDPGSVVKESEFASAARAGGVPERVINTITRAMTGEIITPDQRRDFLKQGRVMRDKNRAVADSVRKQYRGLAERSGLNPIDVVGEDDAPAAAEAAPEAAPAPAAAKPVSEMSTAELEARLKQIRSKK